MNDALMQISLEMLYSTFGKKPVLSTAEVAEALCRTPASIANMRRRKRFPLEPLSGLRTEAGYSYSILQLAHYLAYGSLEKYESNADEATPATPKKTRKKHRAARGSYDHIFDRLRETALSDMRHAEADLLLFESITTMLQQLDAELPSGH